MVCYAENSCWLISYSHHIACRYPSNASEMSTGEPEGGSDLIVNRDTESPEELPSEAQKSTAKPDTPNPDEEGPPDVPSSGAASPEPLLTNEDTSANEVGSESNPTAVLANPVFDEKVEARIELKEVTKETVEVKSEGEVVENE